VPPLTSVTKIFPGTILFKRNFSFCGITLFIGIATIVLKTLVSCDIPNKKNPFGVLSESAGGTNPYFATGAGGFLQSILFGFGGLEITPQGITQLKTSLPKHWKSLTLTGIGKDKKTYIVK
jgi:hypothetical protein